MKKLWILVLIMLLCACITLFACDNANSDSTKKSYTLNFNTVYALAEEAGYTGTLEDLIELFKGENAYQLAVATGYNGTQEDWLATLVGASGKDGITPSIGANKHWYIGDVDTGIAAEGKDGKDGVGIVSIEKTATEGNVDTYTITLTDGSMSTFTLTSSVEGQVGTSVDATDDTASLFDYYLLDDGTWGIKGGRAIFLSEVEIPASYKGRPISTILENAFYYESPLMSGGDYNECRLRHITIPNSIRRIGHCAFQYCPLISLEFPEGLTSIEAGTCMYSFLRSVTIPSTVTHIGYGAFEGCELLKEVFNHSSLDISVGSSDYGYIGSYASNVYTSSEESKLRTDDNGFVLYTEENEVSVVAYVGKPTELSIGENITKIDDFAFAMSNITSVRIGDSVSKIGGSCFYSCYDLKTVEMGNGLTTIEYNMFESCENLTTITIGVNVESIGYSCFVDCYSLKDIYYAGTKAQWEAIKKEYRWDSNTGNYTIHCTDGDIAKGE